eukprot:10278326-Lingulodinium_polyedra.AAC.1
MVPPSCGHAACTLQVLDAGEQEGTGDVCACACSVGSLFAHTGARAEVFAGSATAMMQHAHCKRRDVGEQE